jgi:hypothetical protein
MADADADGTDDLFATCADSQRVQLYLALPPPGVRPYGFGPARPSLSLPSYQTLGPVAAGSLELGKPADVVLVNEQQTATSTFTVFTRRQ